MACVDYTASPVQSVCSLLWIRCGLTLVSAADLMLHMFLHTVPGFGFTRRSFDPGTLHTHTHTHTHTHVIAQSLVV